MPPYGLPHDPGLRSWSSGFSTVTMPSSVEPYTSKRNPSPSLATISCLSAYGTGAALAIRQRIDERSALLELARRAGSRCASAASGAENVFVTRCSFDELRATRPASNLRSTTTGAPSVWASERERERARVVQRAGREVHLVAGAQAELDEQREHELRSVVVRSAPLGFPVVPDV